MVSEAADPGHHQIVTIVTKGAFSEVLDSCTAFERDGAEAPLDEAARANLEAMFTAKGAEGFRVLALATRRVAAKSDYDCGNEGDMVFRGFLVFLDAREKLEDWRRHCNEKRPHSAIGYNVPIAMH